MSIEVLEDRETGRTAFIHTTTDVVFGPSFDDYETAELFLEHCLKGRVLPFSTANWDDMRAAFLDDLGQCECCHNPMMPDADEDEYDGTRFCDATCAEIHADRQAEGQPS